MQTLGTKRRVVTAAVAGASAAALLAPMPDAGATEAWNHYSQDSGTSPGYWVVVDSLIRTHSTSGPMDWEQIDSGLPYNEWQCTTTTGGKASYTFGVYQTNIATGKIVYSVHVAAENVVYTLSSSVP